MQKKYPNAFGKLKNFEFKLEFNCDPKSVVVDNKRCNMYSKKALKDVEHIIKEWLKTGIIVKMGHVLQNIVIVQ